MCDTLVSLSNATGDGSVLFGKNSDREPNEPLIMIRVPAAAREKGQKIKCTYIEVEAAGDVNEVLLMKPSWMWGAEMGINAKGLVIGNEAVFTKEKQAKEPSLLGMDMLRLALESCGTAAEAAEYISYLLERYGQGGKAGYTENLRYHNAFLIADPNEAFVLETAGKRFAVKKLSDFYSISNSLTLQDDFDRSSEEKNVRFKERYDDRLYSYASKGDRRQCFTRAFLKDKKGKLDIRDMMSVLRSHCGNDKAAGFRAGSMYSICMHAGGVISSQTTGSMVARLQGDDITVWAANTSLPCVSLYKPFWFVGGELCYSQEEQDKAARDWEQLEKTRRAYFQSGAPGLKAFLAERDDIEARLMDMAEKSHTPEEKRETMRFAQKEEERLYADLQNRFGIGEKPRRGVYYSYYWKKQNRQLFGGIK